MDELSAQTCEPCRGGIPPLGSVAIAELHAQLDDNWHVIAEHHLQKEFKFPDFKSALAFTNLVGELAEAQGHHPDILLAWGKVEITIWTHKIDGLHQSDFILAAKIDKLSLL
jgi:4a-hydroxytetrahydrobiopterin dehydratase